MPDIMRPLPFEDMPTKPPLTGRPKISDDLQQTVSLIVGWDGATRRLVKVTPSGVLAVCSPPVKGILNIEATTADYDWQGSDVNTSEVMIGCNCKNVGDIWVNVGAAAAPDVGLLLEAGDSIVFSINNLHTLHIHIPTSGEKAIVTYTK